MIRKYHIPSIQKYSRTLGIAITFFIILLFSNDSQSAITSVTCNPASPTNMSTGLGYYLAGMTYDFEVNVQDPLATSWADITLVSIVQQNGFDIDINPDGVNGTNFTVNAGNVSGTCDYSGTYNNFTVTFHVLFQWNSPNLAWGVAGATRRFTATATPPTAFSTHTVDVAYGISTQVRVNNFSMDAEAANGRINPWHNTFTVTGAIVYDIPGASNDDKVFFVNGGGELTSVRLYIDTTLDTTTTTTSIPADAAFTNNNADDISFSVPAAYLEERIYTEGDFGLGDRPFTMEAYFSTAGGPLMVSNNLPLNVDEVEITDITFINGGGIDSDPAGYYRSVNIPGTQVVVEARMRNGLGNVQGDTTIELRDTTDDTITTIIIANNTPSATANLTYAGLTIGAGATQQRNYEIYNIYNGAYGSAAGFGQYQNNSANIPAQPATHTIYWENADPPGANSPPFTADNTVNASSQTIQFEWDPLTTAGPDFDGDFYTYRLYYRESGPGPYSFVDRDTGPAYASLGVIGTNSYTITGLSPLTDYDYVISAVDVFGNEVDDANKTPGDPTSAPGTISTGASEITCTISDGISQINDADFNGDPDPSASATFNLRDSAIKASFFIVTTGNEPDSVKIVVADNASDVTADHGTGTTNDIRTLLEGVDKWTISCSKTAPNTYVGYIPSEHQLIQNGTTIRMILETTFGAGTNHSDHDIDFDPVEQGTPDPTDHEWRFRIGQQPNFKPWPVRILNNVITDKNPVCYPSYYLTDDAFVTITAYDIKGRPVASIIDNAFRRGGQNIKDQGWRGVNKAQRKLGVGLYYIHIKAERASDGKVILNKFKKVVVAR